VPANVMKDGMFGCGVMFQKGNTFEEAEPDLPQALFVAIGSRLEIRIICVEIPLSSLHAAYVNVWKPGFVM